MDEYFKQTAHLSIGVQYFPEDIIAPDEPYQSPERSAHVATLRNRDYSETANYVRDLTLQRKLSPVMLALQRSVDNTDRAVHLMAGIGYMNFRHLQSSGFTLHEICEDINLNVLDLMAYMSSHPEAEKHAELDMDCCADAKMAALIVTLQESPMQSKYEADKLKQLVYATELLVKRLSAKWVGQFRATSIDADGNSIASNAGLTVNMNIGQLNTIANTTNNTQNNYSPAQQEAATQLEAYNKSVADAAAKQSDIIDLEFE